MQLGAVIESVTKVPLGEFFKKRIFEPLGMVDTSFEISREDLGRLVPCFRFTGRGIHYTRTRLHTRQCLQL